MTYTTLISATELQSLVASGQRLMVFDCSFDLTQSSAGAKQYAESHIPGAVYADLNENLSAKHGVPGASGTVTARAPTTAAACGGC
jgi:thiosulfate/3-mercaptopyruvate sulfurtransferase